MVEPILNNALIVNDEASDGSGQLAPGVEALDGDGYAVITVTRANRNPTATDIRPLGQLWLRTSNQALWWSRGGGLWYQFRNTTTIPAHEATHEPNGGDPLPWRTIHGRGTIAARPAASAANAGYLYDATDQRKLYISDGTTWLETGISIQASEYTHTQAVASTLWTVAHNLGRFPKTVSVRDSAGTVCYGGIVHVSVNQLTISFGHPFSGTATVG